MSILTASNRIDYTADGVATTFAFPYAVYTQTDLQVYVTPTGGTSVLKVLNTDYTQTAANVPGGQAGGSVIFSSPPTNNYQVTLIRKLPILQQTSFTNLDKFDAKTAIEGTYDKVVMIEQQLNEVVSRAPVLPVDSLLNPEFPLPGASKFIRWNSSGTSLEAVDITGGALNATMDALNAVNKAGLPTAGQAGRIRYVTDTTRGVWVDQGNQYVSLSGEAYNVKEFGAKGDDSTDDTGAIQAALTAAMTATKGLVVFPPGTYRHTALTLAPAAGQISVNLEGLGGAGASGVILKYMGAGGTAFTIKNNTRFTMRNFNLTNGATGAIGLLVTSLAAGSSTGPALLEDILITGFAKNYVVGEAGGEAASEFAYQGFEVINASSKGIELNASNSLNHNFYGLYMSGNVVGLEAVDPDNIYIYGGSASGNTGQDFAFRQAGAFGIYGYRSENAERFLTVGPDAGSGSASPSNLTIENCRIGQTNNADNRAIRLHKSVQARIANNHIQDGHVSISMANTVSAYVELKGNLMVDGTYLYEFEDNNTSTCEVVARGNRKSTAGTANYWPDEHIIRDLAAINYISTIDLTTPTAPIVKRSHTVVATASLPLAAAAMDGTILIEDAGAGDRNLIVYAGGERFRIDGGANV